MAFERITNNIEELKNNIRAFAHSNSEYYKLKIFKESIKGISSLVLFLLLGIFVSLALIFLSVAIAISINQALDHPSAGYYIVSGFYLLLFILALVFGKKLISKVLLVKLSKALFND